MDLRQLKYFECAAQMGGIGKAATVLGIAQPAVSRTIAALEATLGVSLFERRGAGVKLTDAGERLLVHARDILERIADAEADIASLPATSGTVSVGMTTSAAEITAAKLARRFHASFPDAKIRIVEGFGGLLQEWLARDHIDIALMYDPPASQGLTSETILTEPFYLVSGPMSAVTSKPQCSFDSLDGLPLVLPSGAHNLRRRIEREMVSRKLDFVLFAEIDSLAGIKDLVAGNDAFTVLPSASIVHELEQGLLGASRLTKPNLRRDVCLVHSSHRPLSHLARKALHTVRRLLQDLSDEKDWPSTKAK